MQPALGITILIISIESKRIRTEEIYFRNFKNKNNCSLAKDKETLKRMHIKRLFFRSFNINPTRNKIKEEIAKLHVTNPMLSKIFFICDRDTESCKDSQIQKAIGSWQPLLEQAFGLDNKDVVYLEYDQAGDNFEKFLDLHFNKKDCALFRKNYHKTDRNLYAKTMRKGGKNFETLTNNLEKFQTTWKKLFKVHEWDNYE